MDVVGSINDILNKIKSKNSTVAINISSRSILEVTEIDKNGMIVNYVCIPIQYNAFTKEFENINEI